METHGSSLSHSNFGDNARVQVGHTINVQKTTCLQDLYLTNPRHDKKTIESRKGGLNGNFCKWLFESSEVRQWREDDEKHLLWIHGDPGKGKTMLLCHAINVLEGQKNNKTLMTWFFCQATDSNCDNAVAVLRGLVWMLASQEPRLVSHIEKHHRDAGARLFTDANAWTALSDILSDILTDLEENSVDTYIFVDALDECRANIETHERLVDFITSNSARSRLKWLVTSRNVLRISEQLQGEAHDVSLELNKASISAAVQAYIDHQLDGLAKKKKYSNHVKSMVHRHLTVNANDTFLWVSLVCEQLRKTTRTPTIDWLHQFPPGLDGLYKRILQGILEEDSEFAQSCISMISLVSTAYRPLSLAEMVVLYDVPNDVTEQPHFISEVVRHCTSILTLDDGVVYLVHQSVSDYLRDRVPEEIVTKNQQAVHLDIFRRSVTAMNCRMDKDMYGLRHPGTSIDSIEYLALEPRPPLDELGYSCVYWIDHLEAGISRSQDGNEPEQRPMKKQRRARNSRHFSRTNAKASANAQGGAELSQVDGFLKIHLLHWLEASSLLQSIPKAVLTLTKLLRLVERMLTMTVKSTSTAAESYKLISLVNDARRFAMYFAGGIERYPLQVYVAGLVFSPVNTFPRNLLEHERPQWIIKGPKISAHWDRCLYVLDGHTDPVQDVAFSPNGNWLASGAYDGELKLWDVQTGQCIQTMQHGENIHSLAISPIGDLIASASNSSTKVWSKRGACLFTIPIDADQHVGEIFSSTKLKFLHHQKGQNILIVTCSRFIKSWTLVYLGDSWTLGSWKDVIDTTRFCPGEVFTCELFGVTVSPDLTMLAVFERHGIALYDCRQPGTIRQMTLWNCGGRPKSGTVLFSPDGTLLATPYNNQNYIYDSGHYIQIWARAGDEWQPTRKISVGGLIGTVAFSSNPARLAVGYEGETVYVWDIETGTLTHEIIMRSVPLQITLSTDGTYLATAASTDFCPRIYDLSEPFNEPRVSDTWAFAKSNKGEEEEEKACCRVATWQQRQEIATVGYDGSIKIWHLSANTKKPPSISTTTVKYKRQFFDMHSDNIWSEAYEWGRYMKYLVYSPKGKLLLFFNHGGVIIRNMINGNQDTIRWGEQLFGDSHFWAVVAFSPDETLLAVASSPEHTAFTLFVYSDTGNDVWKLCRKETLPTESIVQPELYELGPYRSDLWTATDSTCGLDIDLVWIMCGSAPVLWLPPEYRPRDNGQWAAGVVVGSTCMVPFCDSSDKLHFLEMKTSQGEFMVG